MKKLLSIMLVSLMLIALLTACGTPVNINTDTSTNTDTDSNVNTDGTETDSVINDQPIKTTAVFSFTYGYGVGDEETNEKSTIELFVNGGYLKNGFESIIIPDDVVAGDLIFIEHTGSIHTESGYPSLNNLVDGELISYEVSYSDVYKLNGSYIDKEKIIKNYDFRDNEEYVILDRYENYTTLEEYDGETLYLVLDKERLMGKSSEDWDETKTPIACMLAYDPRDLKAGIDLRKEKVTINIDFHHPDSFLESASPSWRYLGYIGYNENGNQYIKYAPNDYSYFAMINCKDNVTDAWELIEEALSSVGYKMHQEIDVVALSENRIMVALNNFDTYSLIQEELLDGLSNLESVEKIDVGYMGTNQNDKAIEGYELYLDFANVDEENKIITSYEEFIGLFDLTNIENAELTTITEQTFENSYVVFQKSISYGHCVDEVVVKDARFVDGSLYYTQYDCYYTSGFHCAVAMLSQMLVVVPKADLGTNIPDKFNIEAVDIDMYIEKEK